MIKKIVFLCCLTIFTFFTSFFHEIKDAYLVKKYKERVVYLDFLGGLGNQMFEYSYAYAYAKKHNKVLHYSYNNLLDDLFYMPPQSEAFHFDINNDMTGMKTYYYEQKDPMEIKDIFENGNIFYLSGFFQDSSFFEQERDELLKIFAFKKPLSEKNQLIAEEIKSSMSVSVHFRLGDYFKYALNDILSNHYYLTAMQEIKNKFPDAHFYIFSNDTNYVKQNIKIPFEHTFIEHNNTKETSFWDMYLMSLCKHNIIANSTFSWWSAWLNPNPDKIVIAPSVWLSNKKDYKIIKNILPNNWIKVAPKAKTAVILTSKSEIYLFNKNFIPFDKKSYFVASGKDEIVTLLQNGVLTEYDYVFIATKPFLLNEKIYWDVVPFDTDDVLAFNYDSKSGQFTKADLNTSSDLLSVKGKHLLKILDLYQ